MDDIKGLLQSRTVWANLVALACLAMKQYGWIDEVSTPDQAQLVDVVLSVIGALSTLSAIYFRVKATKRIK